MRLLMVIIAVFLVIFNVLIVAALGWGRAVPAQVIAAIVRPSANPNPLSVVLIDLKGNQSIKMGLPVAGVRGWGFSPDGRRILLFSANLNFQSQALYVYDIPQRRIIHTVTMPGQTAGDVFVLREYSDYAPVWSPDSNKIAFRDPGANGLFMVDLVQDETRQVFRGAMVFDISWSGQQVAFIADRQLHLLDATTYDLQTIETQNAQSPRWSNGRIAFFQLDEANRTMYLYVREADGTLRNISDEFGEGYLPQWSPDGEWMVFYAGREGERLAYTLHLPTNTLYPLPAQDVRDVAWGGRYLTVSTYVDLQQRHVYVMTPQGEVVQDFITRWFDAEWSPDGEQLVYGVMLTSEDGGLTMYKTDFSGEPLLMAYDYRNPVWIGADDVAYILGVQGVSGIIYEGRAVTDLNDYVLEFVYWED